ncbi:DUF2071 domain-containing protein [Yinghuangia sp. ASG 101]|uniref:YqjF family protein n=1 Tax=Yinghuangia sp. ASG 101 TaxID=2896848 RepID=UPI001E4B3B44|nr:DUF2071 domain-containing protein [Yinghuangia sp. ASG 101]UGQ12759.1 DUF2071 domain-containing protein [Yinghuangia sp. ASG 101]
MAASASPSPSASPAVPEPVTPDAPRTIARPLLTQSWRDVAFVHWAAAPDDVAPLLPPGTRPDTLDGVTYIGLVPFRMHRVGWLGLPGLPYLGSFPETNVRLYSVDEQGRRGVVFLSLDASRLVAVGTARAGFGLPYVWSRMSVHRGNDTVAYVSSRHRGRGADNRVTVRIGNPIAQPTELEHFVTARWGLHHRLGGRTRYLPNAHPRWPLRRAELTAYDSELIVAAGLPEPVGEPVSVLFSPGVPVRFGRPC